MTVRKRWIMVLVAGALLLIVPVPGFSQTTGETVGYVTFITTPPGASVSIGGVPIGTTPIYDYAVTPGSNLYTITLEGYSLIQKSFSVSAGQHVTVTNTLQPLNPTTRPTTIPTTAPPGSGSIYATTSPSGAAIYLNGAFQGYSPIVIRDLQPRAYTVAARLDGYSDYATTIQVYAGSQSTFSAVLQPSPVHHDYGYISVSSSPAGASILIDGSYKGTTPASILEYPGIHTVLLQLSGYYDSSQQVSVAADTTQYVSVTMSPVQSATTGSLYVSSSPSASNVYLNGAYRGQTNSGGILLIQNLPAGSYQVMVTHPQYNNYVATVSISPGAQSAVQATLTPIGPTATATPVPGKTGSLSISSVPSGAQIYIDNAYRGISPAVFDGLATGNHAVTLTSPGYSDFQGIFVVTAGTTTPVSATLDPQPTPTPSAPSGLVLVTGLIAAGLIILRRRP